MADEENVSLNDRFARAGEAAEAEKKRRKKRERPSEIKLTAVLMDPAKAKLTGVEKAELAGISERTYRRLMADPEFVQSVRDQFLSRVFEQVAPIVDAAERVAVVPTKDGFNDRRMLLEMAGLVETTANARHSGEVKTTPAQLVIIEMLGGADPVPESGADPA